MKHRNVIWKPVDYEGLEHLSLYENEQGIQAEGVVIAVPPEGVFRLDYQIQCEPGYLVRDVRLAVAGGETLHLMGDGNGRWFDDNDQHIPDFDGCLDIDISATPFTNTLPIKRLRWKAGQSETFNMVWISIPDMTVHVDAQKYTCVAQTANSSIFRFEQINTDFSALLAIDNDGLVVDYPGLFMQI